MLKQPAVSIKLVLRAHDRVLMLHHANGSWEFPGGRLEWGESLEEALKRELLEELDYALPAPPTFLSVYNYVSKDNKRHSVILHYLLPVDHQPQLHTTDEEPDATVVWLTKDELSAIVPDPEFIKKVYASTQEARP